MLASIEELLFAFPDTPVPLRLPSEHLQLAESSLLPFRLQPAQSAYPREFVPSNFVCHSVLTPTLTEWLDWCRVHPKAMDLPLCFAGLLIDRSQRRSSLWLSSRNGHGFSDAAGALSAFLAWNTFEIADLDGQLRARSYSLLSEEQVQHLPGRRWFKVETQDRLTAEAILADEPFPRFTGDPSKLTFRAVLVFTAPDVVPAAVLDDLSVGARTLVIDADNNGMAEAKLSGTHQDIYRVVSSHAAWWLVHVGLTTMWRRMSELRVRMGILATSEGTVILYANDGAIHVSDRIPTGQACATRPLGSSIPLFLAIQLLPNAAFQSPPELSVANSEQPSRTGIPPLWKLMDALEMSPRLTGFHYLYRPCFEEPEETAADFDMSVRMEADSASPDTPNGGDALLGEIATLTKLGAPSICIGADPGFDVPFSPQPWNLLLNCNLLLFGPVHVGQLGGRSVPQLHDGFSVTPPSLPRYIRPQPLLFEDEAGEGALWSCVKVTAPSSGPPLPFPMVAKIRFPDLTKAHHTTLQLYEDCGISLPLQNEAKTARTAIYKELANLNALGELQGTVIPRVGGLYGGVANGEEVWMLFLEDVGPEVERDRRIKFSKADEREILDKYRRIHEAGFVHGDVAIKHWRRHESDKGKAGSIRIIDFDHSTARADVDPETFENLVEAEMSEVRYIFGLGLEREDSRALPVVRRRRFLCF